LESTRNEWKAKKGENIEERLAIHTGKVSLLYRKM
jgi:hypothetical protein